jgi:hypothetical protein
MKVVELRSASTDMLLVAYVEAASGHGRATLASDPEAANRCAEEIAAIYREFRFRGGEAQERLLELIGHNDVGIRSWAAAHALEFASGKGIPALERIACSGPWPLNVTAQVTLDEWEKGELRFP